MVRKGGKRDAVMAILEKAKAWKNNLLKLYRRLVFKDFQKQAWPEQKHSSKAQGKNKRYRSGNT